MFLGGHQQVAERGSHSLVLRHERRKPQWAFRSAGDHGQNGLGYLHGRKDLAGESLFSVTESVPLSDDSFPSERRTVEDPPGKVLTTVYWNRSPPVITSPSCKFLADLRSVSFRSACERRQSGLGLPGLTVCNPSLWRASSE
jgi:hypothetical protein